VHRVEEIKYPEVFDRLPQGVHARVLSRLEVARENLKRVNAFEVLKGRQSKVTLQKLSSSGRVLVHFTEVVKERTSNWNSLWRIHEVVRTMGFSEFPRRLSIG
jgi:hypothetical protein